VHLAIISSARYLEREDERCGRLALEHRAAADAEQEAWRPHTTCKYKQAQRAAMAVATAREKRAAVERKQGSPSHARVRSVGHSSRLNHRNEVLQHEKRSVSHLESSRNGGRQVLCAKTRADRRVAATTAVPSACVMGVVPR